MRLLTLLMYAVYEKTENGMRIWYKNYHKGFLLPDQLAADAIFLNPIRLVLNSTEWGTDGDYT